MGHKKCNRCKQKKAYKDFHRDTSRLDGFSYTCKPCKNAMPSMRRGTVAYFVKQSWHALNRRTVNGKYPDRKNPKNAPYFAKGIRLEMSRSEFKSFCETHKATIRDLYKQGKTPSLDRIDSQGHYSIDNIQIISLSENVRKSNVNKNKGVSK